MIKWRRESHTFELPVLFEDEDAGDTAQENSEGNELGDYGETRAREATLKTTTTNGKSSAGDELEASPQPLGTSTERTQVALQSASSAVGSNGELVIDHEAAIPSDDIHVVGKTVEKQQQSTEIELDGESRVRRAAWSSSDEQATHHQLAKSSGPGKGKLHEEFSE